MEFVAAIRIPMVKDPDTQTKRASSMHVHSPPNTFERIQEKP